MIDLYWRGVDGSVWDLIRGPVRVTADGLQNLLMPGPVERRVRESSNRDGQQRTGGRRLARYPVVPVLVFTEGPAVEWSALYQAWSASLSDVTTGELVVINTETGHTVALTCAVNVWPADPQRDPSYTRHQRLVYEFVADDPYWYLPTVSVPIVSSVDEPVNYYGGDGLGGYPFVRGAGSQAGRVQVVNPGTEPVHWVAQFPSPSAGFAVTIDGHTVSGGYPVPAGAVLELDSADTAFWLVQNGTRSLVPWHEMESIDFARIRPGTQSEVAVFSVGAGIPTLTFRPRRREAL